MAFWDKLFGKPKAVASAPGTPGPAELGTMDAARTILLDSGRAVRVHPDEALEAGLGPGARVAVRRLEVDGKLTWARGISRTDQPYQQRALELVPPQPPPPPPPEVVAQRQREYAEGQARRKAREREKRQQWRAERVPGQLEAQRSALQRRLDEAGAKLPVAQLLAKAQPALRAVAIDGEAVQPDGSRLGGEPWLPPPEPWPDKDGRPLAFIGQWRLSDLPPGIVQLELPAEGQLLFFYDVLEQPWGFEPDDRGSWAVRFVAPGTPAQRRPFPEALPAEARLRECPLAFGATWTLPSPFSDRYPERAGDASTDAAWDLVQALREDELELPQHQVGGWPAVIQSDMEEECQLASGGVRMGSPADHAATYRPGAEEGASDWALLFQVDTDEAGPGWMWGDCGMIYFWIRRADLARRDFSKVWLVLQCT